MQKNVAIKMKKFFNSLTAKIESLRSNLTEVTKRKIELIQREADCFFGILNKLTEDLVKAQSENTLNKVFKNKMNWRLDVLECIREKVPELGKIDFYRGGIREIYRNGKKDSLSGKADLYRNGNGVYILEKRIYIGEFYNDYREGKGLCLYNSGDRYEGQYNNGLANGKGIYTYASGSKYEGDFIYGQGHGKGIFTYVGGDR